MILWWRRIDVEGLERLSVDGSNVHGSLMTLEAGGYRLDHRWRLDDGRAQALTIERRGADGRRTLHIARAGSGWTVDGMPRPDLDGAEEPDISATPFCNTLPIRRLRTPAHTLDTVYVDATTLTVERSRQRYERIDARHVRYVDLGAAKGFTAVLRVDAHGLVEAYEGLFERVVPQD